jgi:hypothetical protein
LARDMRWRVGRKPAERSFWTIGVKGRVSIMA